MRRIAQDRSDHQRFNQAHTALIRMEYTPEIEQDKGQEAEEEVWSLEDSVKILQTGMRSLGEQQSKLEATIKDLTASFQPAMTDLVCVTCTRLQPSLSGPLPYSRSCKQLHESTPCEPPLDPMAIFAPEKTAYASSSS